MTTTNGTVLAISTVPLGDELAADALTGATSITIADAADFAETGGTLLINGQLTDYTAADDETGIVTLVDALVADASAGDRVDLADPSGATATEWRALVAPIGNTDNDDAVDAAVGYPLIPLLPEGIRAPGTGESVTLTLDGSEWQLTNVHGKRPNIEGDNLATVDIEVGDTTGFPNAVAIAATTGSGPNASATRTEAVAVGFNSAAGADYSAAFGAETSTGAAGSVAIGTDDTGAGTATSTVNEIKLGTALHTVMVIGQLRIGKSKQTTVGVAGAASALPATPAAYLPITASDGTEYLMPVYLKP